MKKIKVLVTDWWAKDTEENFYNNFFIKKLSEFYEVIYSREPDFVIFGPFGLEHLKYKNAVKIFITGEVAAADFNVADYAISFEYMHYGDRHLRFPYAFWNKNNYELASKKHSHVHEIRDKFCSFMVSMPSKDSPRDEFFKQLCEYKKVESGGRHLNNVGGGYIADKIAWLRNYKFNICFENSKSVGYFTEKMMDAWAAGCVPIYWGDPSIKRRELTPNPEYKINPKSFINMDDFSTFSEAIEEIKRIDNDDEAYFAMLREPAFLDECDWCEFYENKLSAFFRTIFEQDAQAAKRISPTHYVRRYIRNTYNIVNIGYLQYKLKHIFK